LYTVFTEGTIDDHRRRQIDLERLHADHADAWPFCLP
jgi:hypothetical protein